MGFWARLFGGDKSATSGAATSAEVSDSKPEVEAQTPEPVVAPEPVPVVAEAPASVVVEEPAPVVAEEPAPSPEPIAKSEDEAQAPEPPAAEAPEAVVEPEPEEAEDEEPEEELDAPEPEPLPFPEGVEFQRTTFGAYPLDPQFMATKKVYRTANRDAAIAFLKTQAVTEPMVFIEVETPQGPVGIDEGQRIFDESGAFIEA